MLWGDLQACALSMSLFQPAAQVRDKFRHVGVSGINVVIISANRVDEITPRKFVGQKHKESIFQMKIKGLLWIMLVSQTIPKMHGREGMV